MDKTNPVVCLDCNGMLYKMTAKRVKCFDCEAEFTLSRAKSLEHSIDRKCVICGALFVTTANKKTCTRLCKMKLLRQNAARNQQIRKEKNN